MQSLTELSQIDIRTADKDSLIDIKKLEQKGIPEGYTKEERLLWFMEHVGNPYCFRVGKVAVKTTFTEGATLHQRFEELLHASI